MKLVFNKRSDAVGMSSDSQAEGLGAAFVAGFEPHPVQWYFIFLPTHIFFRSTCISIDPGPQFFIEVCLNP